MSVDIISQVESMERRGDEMIVRVAVRGPVGLDKIMELRARGRAFVASGAVPTFVDTVGDVPAGIIQRFTRVQSVNKRPGNIEFRDEKVPVLGKLLKDNVYTVAVRRE